MDVAIMGPVVCFYQLRLLPDYPNYVGHNSNYGNLEEGYSVQALLASPDLYNCKVCQIQNCKNLENRSEHKLQCCLQIMASLH